MKRLIILLLILFCNNQIFAQNRIDNLKPPELSLLKILLADSINDANFTIPTKLFNFGLEEALFGNFNIIKRKQTILLQPIGTGRVYQVVSNKKQISLVRIDKTTHTGTNFFAQNFLSNDTLFQFGGLGFWQIRGFNTFFSTETNQWELLKANKSIPSFFNDNYDAILHVQTGTNPILYLSNSYFLKYFPEQFDIESVDSVFAFHFHQHKWHTLGKLNPLLKKILSERKSREMEIHLDNYFITQNQLNFYWIDFKNNLFGNLKSDANLKLRLKWLSFYNDVKRGKDQVSFQFLMGRDLYFFQYIEGTDLKMDKLAMDINLIDFSITNPVYLNERSIFTSIWDFIKTYKTTFITTIIVILLFVLLFLVFKSKKKLPNEVNNMLNKKFFTTLNAIEKELIQVLYQHYQKNEGLPTKIINKIIGVQQKDTLTQNKSRSDYFIRINQKFKMATHHTEPLIIKQRDSADKRQYNYSLNANYIGDIEKLLNH